MAVHKIGGVRTWHSPSSWRNKSCVRIEVDAYASRQENAVLSAVAYLKCNFVYLEDRGVWTSAALNGAG